MVGALIKFTGTVTYFSWDSRPFSTHVFTNACSDTRQVQDDVEGTATALTDSP